MKYCKNCGSQIDENAIFCPRCGARTNGDGPAINFNTFGGGYNTYGGYGYQNIDTTPSKAVAVLSFLFWWVGLAIWAFCRHTRPGKAHSALMGLLSSACVSIPLVGLVIWALWKDDPEKRDMVKVSAVSAIVGAAFYALMAILSTVLVLTGAADAGWYATLVEAVFIR
jgi:hypothetical protein